jgi:hypothetical protein
LVLALLLDPDRWRLIVVDLRRGHLLIGYWRRLIQVRNWGWLVGVSNRGRLIVDLGRLGR